jgi:hypothetical protein
MIPSVRVAIGQRSARDYRDGVRQRGRPKGRAGKPVASENSTIGVDQFASGRTADHYLTVPLATLAPGEYLLQLETTLGSRLTGRAIRFAVKP